jgi:hypothetical protein
MASKGSGRKRAASAGSIPHGIPKYVRNRQTAFAKSKAKKSKRPRQSIEKSRYAKGNQPPDRDILRADLAKNLRICLTSMPGLYGTYTPISASKQINLSVADRAKVLHVSWNAMGIAFTTFTSTPTQYEGTHTVFDELIQAGTELLQVRPSRKTISVTCTSGVDQANGVVWVSSIPSALDVAIGAGGSVTLSHWEALINAATTEQGATMYSAAALTKSHHWSTCFASALQSAEWQRYYPYVAGSYGNIETYWQKNATTTLVLLFQPTSQSATDSTEYVIQVNEQLCSRWEARSMMSTNRTDSTFSPPASHQKHFAANGAVPHSAAAASV